jgi:hypothetical protein
MAGIPQRHHRRQSHHHPAHPNTGITTPTEDGYRSIPTLPPKHDQTALAAHKKLRAASSTS